MKSQEEQKAQFMFARLRAERERAELERPVIREEGIAALKRLVKIAQGDSGQCRHVAAFVLGLYNGDRFRFDLTDFRSLDREIFNDCLAVLKMDNTPEKEVHRYFDNGGELFEKIAKDWGLKDFLK